MTKNKLQSTQTSVTSHLLRVLFVLGIIIVILCILLIFLFLILLLLGVVLLLLLSFLVLAECLPLLRKLIGIGHIITDNDVVEDGSAFHLPQIEADEAEVSIFVDGIVILVFWIVNFL